MAFAEDFDVFLDPYDFGEAFTWGASTIYGIFDNETYSVDNVNGVPVDIQRPSVLVKDSDITGMTQGANVTRVASRVTYSVQVFAPDGTGMTILGLKRDAIG